MLRVLHRTGVILLAGPLHAFRGILGLRKQPIALGEDSMPLLCASPSWGWTMTGWSLAAVSNWYCL